MVNASESATTVPRSKIFTKISQLVQNRHFENFIIVLIVLSSVALAVEPPKLDVSTTLGYILYELDLFFTVVFTAEMALKIFVLGLFGYFETGWNRLDAFIVIISLVSLLAPEVDISFLRTLRFLRVLRPLRCHHNMLTRKMLISTLAFCIAGSSVVRKVCALSSTRSSTQFLLWEMLFSL